MKVLFLDFDGPMIPSRAAGLSPGATWTTFDPVAVHHINKILDKRVTLVISSSWRYMGMGTIRMVLSLNGIDPGKMHSGEWCTKTPVGVDDVDKETFKHLKNRTAIILDWVERHKDENITHWVALDDMKLNLPEENFVRCSTFDGLLTQQIQELWNKLNLHLDK